MVASSSAPRWSSRTKPPNIGELGASMAAGADQRLRTRTDCGSVFAMRFRRRCPRLQTLMAGLVALARGDASLVVAASAEIPGVAQRQRTEKKIFTDGEIVEGFFKTAFGAEYHLPRRVDPIPKKHAPAKGVAGGT